MGAEHLGQWIEANPDVYHIKRRLNPDEAALVGPLRDIRGTEEARLLLEPLRHLLPPDWSE